MWMITKLFSHLSSIFFPTYCYLCKKEGLPDESICAACLLHFRKPIDTPAPYINSMYSFKEPVIKKIIHAIKYFHRKDLLNPLAKIIAQEIIVGENLSSYTLIPIPMPTFRKYIRGYNHTEALVNKIAVLTSLEVRTDLLLRNPLKSKKRQVMTQSRSERLKNQHNAFTIQGNVSGMSIVVIDDVTTTGATLSEARKILLEHGASRVVAFTIAH
jgi:competence protein ComFC